MIRAIVPCIAAGAFAGACSAPSAPDADVAAVLAATLPHEARSFRDHEQRICVRRATEGVAFDERRAELRRARSAPRASNPDEREARERWAAAAASGSYDWHEPDGPEGAAARTQPIDAALHRVLDERAAALIAVEPPPQPARRIARGWLEPPLRRPLIAPFCDTLSVTRPAFSGADIAFVETTLICGGFCGGGRLYALRRGRDGWRVVASAVTWVS